MPLESVAILAGFHGRLGDSPRAHPVDATQFLQLYKLAVGHDPTPDRVTYWVGVLNAAVNAGAPMSDADFMVAVKANPADTTAFIPPIAAPSSGGLKIALALGAGLVLWSLMRGGSAAAPALSGVRRPKRRGRHARRSRGKLDGLASGEDEESEFDEPKFDEEPVEGDLTTEDDVHFWTVGSSSRYPAVTLQVRSHDLKHDRTTTREAESGELSDSSMWRQLDAYMNARRFWPNVWRISDHGNAVLLTRPKRIRRRKR